MAGPTNSRITTMVTSRVSPCSSLSCTSGQTKHVAAQGTDLDTFVNMVLLFYTLLQFKKVYRQSECVSGCVCV